MLTDSRPSAAAALAELQPGEGTVSGVRTLLMAVSGPPIVTSGYGRQGGIRFLPAQLRIEWHSGVLHTVMVNGVKIKNDGEPYAGSPREAVMLMTRPESGEPGYVLAPWAPQWIRDLITQYAPPEPSGVTVIPEGEVTRA